MKHPRRRTALARSSKYQTRYLIEACEPRLLLASWGIDTEDSYEGSEFGADIYVDQPDDFWIDWGDGSSDSQWIDNDSAHLPHTYDDSGHYTAWLYEGP